MAARKDERAARNLGLVLIDEDWQLQYWTTRLQVSADELKQAIDKVGNAARQVEANLGASREGRWRLRDRKRLAGSV